VKFVNARLLSTHTLTHHTDFCLSVHRGGPGRGWGAMSSEQFEHYEYEFDNINKSITRKINTQLPNYTGGVPLQLGFFFAPCPPFSPFFFSALAPRCTPAPPAVSSIRRGHQHADPHSRCTCERVSCERVSCFLLSLATCADRCDCQNCDSVVSAHLPVQKTWAARAFTHHLCTTGKHPSAFLAHVAHTSAPFSRLCCVWYEQSSARRRSDKQRRRLKERRTW
jgi:hypothetical protein